MSKKMTKAIYNRGVELFRKANEAYDDVRFAANACSDTTDWKQMRVAEREAEKAQKALQKAYTKQDAFYAKYGSLSQEVYESLFGKKNA